MSDKISESKCLSYFEFQVLYGREALVRLADSWHRTKLVYAWFRIWATSAFGKQIRYRRIITVTNSRCLAAVEVTYLTDQ